MLFVLVFMDALFALVWLCWPFILSICLKTGVEKTVHIESFSSDQYLNHHESNFRLVIIGFVSRSNI